MADKRSSIIKTVKYRKSGTADAYVETDLVGDGITVEDAANRIPLADGTMEKAGSAVRVTIPLLDPALFASLNTWQEDGEQLEVIITLWEGPDATLTYDPLGFTATPLEAGQVGQLEGVTLNLFVYGLVHSDYLALSQALT